MKSYLFFVSLLIAMGSCDVVPYNEAYEKALPVIPIDTTQQADTNYLAVTSFSRKVLVEDYTGHTCGNCPFAALEAHKIEELYSGKVVTMGIHCGFFAEPKTFPNGSYKLDFRTPTGDELDSKFKASAAGLPRGVVGRRKFDNSFLLLHTAWASKVSAILAEVSPGVGLRIHPQYNESNRSVVVYTNLTFEKAITGQLKMSSYLVEDSVVAWQKLYPTPNTTQNIEKYVHNHVLRSGLLPSAGTDLVTSGASISANSNFKTTWQIVLPDGVKPQHSKIITIVYRVDSDEVLQVDEAYLIEK